MLLIFEGKDASGKGGAIKRIVEPLDPRHYRVDSFSAPTPDELRHNFLWRFAHQVPGKGGMVLFDRSWYGRVLVERVEGFATDDAWGRAYDEITQYEQLIAQGGLIVVKYWMAVSDDEQQRRFDDRATDPLKSWKLTDEDVRNSAKSASYDEAAEEMFERTDHDLAPWLVIGADHKRNARVAVLETLISQLELGMARWDVPVPDPL